MAYAPRYRDDRGGRDDYYASDDPYSRRPRRNSPGPSHRRHKSEHRRHPSPGYDSPPSRSRRDHHRESKPRRHSPPPYTTEPRRGHHSSRDSRRRDDYLPRDPNDRDRAPRKIPAYDGDVSRSRREARDGPRERRQDPRDHYQESRSRRSPRKSSPMGTGRPKEWDAASEEKKRSSKQRTRSYDRGGSRGNSPARGGKHAAAAVGAGAGATAAAAGAGARRNSLPANTKAMATKAAAKGAQWWKNPLIQAGARTALTAGAQAAMSNRGAQGPWMGAKGAKVASAALGAALMDGFVSKGGGNQHDDRRDDRGRSDDRRDDRRDDRGRSGGGSGSKKQSTKEMLLQQGMNFVASRASGGRR